jgi:DNA modification methylase
MTYTIYTGNNLDILPTLPDNSVDSIVTDPPYELNDRQGNRRKPKEATPIHLMDETDHIDIQQSKASLVRRRFDYR